MEARNYFTGILIVGFLLVGAVPVVIAGSLLADLENALMCKCDDKCGKVLINCTCSTADKTRAEFTKMLDSGLTIEQIVQGQVEKYGETVLSAPTKDGFNLTAWVTPFGALLVGGYGVRRVLQTWTQKKQPPLPESGKEDSADQSQNHPSEKYSRQLQDELDRIEN